MKALKVLGIIVLVAVALVFIIPLFMAETTSVSANINIKASPATVFHQVDKLKNWENWSPFETDSTIVNTYEGNERGKGAIRHWNGKKAGSGTITILESEPYNKIVNKLEFGDGSGGEGSWSFNSANDSLHVNWTITINNLSYPMGRLMSPLMKMILKPMLEKGLVSLREVSEKEGYSPDIKIVELPQITTLAIYDSAKISGIGALLQTNYGRIMDFIKLRGYQITGAPLAIYHNWDPAGYIKISAAIPLINNVKGKKDIRKFEIEAGKAVFAKHFGGYDTGKTHEAIDEFIKDFNLETKDFIWESYITDPSTEPDSSKWQTDIYYPLK
jgi:effector-binding domain-containing protein